MVGLSVTATVSDTSAGYNFDGVTATGSGVTAPLLSDYTAENDASVTGKTLNIDLAGIQTPETGYELCYYEAAVENDGGGVEIVHLPYEDHIGKTRRVICSTANNAKRVRIRSVQKQLRYFEIDNGPSGYIVQVGDTITHTATGSTATVKALFSSRWVLLEDVVAGTYDGQYALFNNLAVQDGEGALSNDLVVNDGTTNYDIQQATFIQPATPQPQFDTDTGAVLKSEWSDPKIVTLTTGTPQVTINAQKTTCLQGEPVLLKCDTSGFDCEYDTLELDFKWSVAKAGEQGSFDALTGTVWESHFGTGQNNRCEGTTRTWCFAPKTTGADIVVTLDVWDRSGNHAQATKTLTSVAPLSAFNNAEIYVCSTSNGGNPRAVPGDTGIPAGNFYTDIDTLVADLPAIGEGLILLDTAGSLGASTNSTVSFKGKIPDRCVIMPYDASGVGPEASTQTTIDFTTAQDSTVSGLYGIISQGPFDPTNPYAFYPIPAIDGVNQIGASQCWVSSTVIKGWEFNYNPGAYPATFTIFDCNISDYRNYGIYQPDPGDRAIAGALLTTDPQTWVAYDVPKSNTTTPPIVVGHVGIRWSRPDGVVGISKSVLVAVGGHSSPGQPCYRSYGGAQYYPYSQHLEEVYLEQRPNFAIGTSSATADNYDGAQDYRLNRFVLILSEPCRTGIAMSVAPCMISNGLIGHQNRDKTWIGGQIGGAIFDVSKGGNAGMFAPKDCINQKFMFECITGYSLNDPTNDNGASELTFLQTDSTADSTAYPNISVRNCLAYSALTPVAASSLVPEATGTLEQVAQYTPWTQDKREWDDTMGGTADGSTTDEERLAWNLANSVDTTIRAQPEQTYTLIPSADSNAYQAATGTQPRFDMLGRVRTATAHWGAYSEAL